MSFIFYFINITTSVIIIIIMFYQFWDFYRTKRKNELPLLLIICLIIIAFIAGLILTHFLANSHLFEDNINISSVSETKNKLQNPGLLGDSAGVVNALFSALALAGVVYTLYLQRSEIDSNQKDVAIEKFETKFYEMIHLHKQNVAEIHVGSFNGREAIEKLFYYLEDIYKRIETAILTIENITPPENDQEEVIRYNRMKTYLSDSNNRLNFIHELSYGYFFYGIEKYYITKDEKDVKFDLNVDVTVILIDQKTPKDLLTPRNTLLGHYFRHLYQTVQLVANENNIKEEDKKYMYIKMLRAQLSDFEQALLYYNSLSVMGAKWVDPIGKKEIEEMCLIARFRLIKNMPYYFEYFGKHPGDYFKVEKEACEAKGKRFFELDLT